MCIASGLVKILFIVLYVYDMLLAGNNIKVIKDVKL